MAVNLSPVFGVAGQLFDNNGNPLAGGKIYTYLAGTTTPATTYTNSTGSIAHSNPIVLDGAGRVPSGEIWLTDGITYKFVVQDSANNLIGTYDNLTGINSNFVAYTSQQEIQTATAGQTVFTLTTMQYQPNTNNLSVFVDGVNQYGPGAQYAFIETDSTTVTFVSGLHVGASVKFTTASPVSTSVTDAENVSYTPPYTGSIETNVENKLAQTVSVYDFMTAAEIADVQSFAPTLNVTSALQAAINAVEPGQRLYIPWGFYKHTGLTIDKAMFIYGDLPPQLWDNDSYNALNKGTILWQYQSTGNNLTVEPPDAPDRRLMFHMQDILLVGAIWTGTAFNGTPTSGHGLYINGRNAQPETQVICSWERIGACFHAEHGAFLTGSIYGCDMGMFAGFSNGKNNFRMQSTAEPIGEISISHLRCFGGGSLASNDIDKSNIYLRSGGLVNIGFISATVARTYAVLFGGGRWNVGSIQTESLSGTIDASRVIIQFGDGSTNPSASQIGIVTFAPGTNYPGTAIKFKNGCRNNVIQEAKFDDAGATGDLVVFETNSEGNAVFKLTGTTTGTEIVDNGNFNIHGQFFSIPSGLSASGLWSAQNIGVGKFNIGNVSTETGHAFYIDGTANFSTDDSGAGGIGYLETNYNAGVPDGWKFHSFRIGTPTPIEIGKIEVASSGTAINYATSSDYRLKENAQPMTGALERICKLNPVTFTWKTKQVSGEGFIAHELQEVFPAAVTGKKDEIGADGEPLYQGVDASKIIAALVSAVQELTERVKQLEGQ